MATRDLCYDDRTKRTQPKERSSDRTFVLQGKETAENGKIKRDMVCRSRIGDSKLSGLQANEV
jgi:hypothetical protein